MSSYLRIQLEADPVLSLLSEEARVALIATARLKSASKGQAVYRKGDRAGGLLYLLKGRLSLGATTLAGQAFVLTTLSPGEWFGEISVLDGKLRTHDVMALTDSDFALLPLTDIQRLSARFSEIETMIVQLMCVHMRAAFDAIDDFLLLNPEQRLAKRVIEMQRRQPTGSVGMSQQDLSDLMGVSRQSISKILKKWEAKRVIKRAYRGFSIVSQAGLQCISEPD